MIKQKYLMLKQKILIMKKTNLKKGIDCLATTHSASSTNKYMQFPRYKTRQGHGYAAEDANAMIDRLKGRSVEQVGGNNLKNGPDRIVNGIEIQTKYCQTPRETLNSAFTNDSYRYGDMKLEVPKEQYEEVVKLMGEKIREGKVPGIKNPLKAKEIVIKGAHTYNEARNIVKAGTIDSIKFDAKTQAITCSVTCGLTFAHSYYNNLKMGKSHSNALKQATIDSAKSGIKVLAIGVTTQQLLRTSGGRLVAAKATHGARMIVNGISKTEIGTKVIERVASTTVGQKIVGEAAKGAVSKGMRTNIVTAGVMLVGQTGYDVYKLSQGKISGGQLCKNVASNTAGLAGGYAGAAAGAAIGSMILPGVGTAIGGFIGSIGGGMTASTVMNKITNIFN